MTPLNIFIVMYSLIYSLQAVAATEAHERLRVRNTFKAPEEVVSYYCARDASGFVWSGLLDIERKAFTVWKEAPQQDSFYIAKDYQIKVLKNSGTLAQVQVDYELLGVGDANSARMEPPVPIYKVVFQLKKIESLWKIEKPDPNEISPIVLRAKFPIATASK
jgi:hypothetical protein